MPCRIVNPQCEFLVPVQKGDWPLRSHLALGPLPSAIPCARLHARHVLWEWGIRDLTDSVELLVSELTTNAITATRSTETGPPVRFWLLSHRKQVLLMVWDANPNPPVPIQPDACTEVGRGLMLGQPLSSRGAWHPVPARIEGKFVWPLAS